MKILTNIRFYRVAGIAQTLLSFVDYLKRYEPNINIVGVDVHKKGEPRGAPVRGRNKIFSLLSPTVAYRRLDEVVRRAKTVDDIRLAYQDIINVYVDLIAATKPDIILVNGTFVLPWCLWLASQQFDLPVVLHYHGILRKEVPHWPARGRALIGAMEKLLWSDKAYYIFPSVLARAAVAQEIFNQEITNFSIVRNPVRSNFFNAQPLERANNIGFVTRWTPVKNFSFIENLARYNRAQGNYFCINIVSDLKRSHASRQKMRTLVKFKNTVENRALARFYAKMRVVLSPSLFETYGNVAQEALACGTPALINKNMGVAELFCELGLEKWIVDFDSLPTVWDKTKEAAALGVDNAVREKLQAIVSPEKIYGDMIKIFRSL